MTGLWNYLDCPAAIIPFGKVLETDVAELADKVAKFGAKDAEMYELCRSHFSPDLLRVCQC
jgi:hypothetical protein